MAAASPADRQAMGKITADGVFLEELERAPGKYLPEVTDDKLSSTTVKVRRRRMHARMWGPAAHAELLPPALHGRWCIYVWVEGGGGGGEEVEDLQATVEFEAVAVAATGQKLPKCSCADLLRI